MTEHRYTVILTQEPDGSAYNVTVPALPGCLTFGATVEEAIERAKDAIALYLEDVIASGEPIPEERQPAVQIASVTVAA